MKDEARLELPISYTLLGGVVVSLILECLGLVLYYSSGENPSFNFTTSWQLTGANFFTFVTNSLVTTHATSFTLMVSGVIVLMLIPYFRVILSFVYFLGSRDWKYSAITAFVLVVLTLSLALR